MFQGRIDMASLTHGATRRIGLLAALAVVALGFSACAPAAPVDDNPDNGTTLTMWARDANGGIAEEIVAAYNESHDNQIKLTVVPSDSYQTKVGAAAGSGGLPDILAADVVYSPNYVQQGVFQDITAEVDALPFRDDISPAHIEAASLDGKLFGVPMIVDSSLIMYNKDLYSAAGLDPEQGPTSFDEIYEQAKAIRDNVGGDTYGFYFPGGCNGCNAYTMFGYLAAAGEPPFAEDGAVAQIDTDAMDATLSLYKKLYDEGIVPETAMSDDGAQWAGLFNEGKIGILPIGNFNFSAAEEGGINYGVVGLPAPDGSSSSGFVGGDMVGISKDSKHPAQAWNFMEWLLGDEAQVDVIAKGGLMPSRVDLADNEFSSENPATVSVIRGLATGYTPASTAYGVLVNDSTGAWQTLLGDYIFKADAGALETAQKTFQSEIDAAK
jgi:multiple sugar transport system substrate-binding protein